MVAKGKLKSALGQVALLYRQGGLPRVASAMGARLSLRRHAFNRRKRAEDARFDAAHGCDTGGVQHLAGMTVMGGNAAAGTNHVAAPPDEFDGAIAALGPAFDLAAATFVDLGAGKGRALIMAAALPFRRILGVEFAAELLAIARANVERLGLGARIELVHGDAALFVAPAEPLVLFLYNAFGPPVLTTVAERLLCSWRELPRLVRVIYLNPVYEAEWTMLGWNPVHRDRGLTIFAPPD